MAAPYEQDVVLDTDGKSVFNALELVQKRIDKIQESIKLIHTESFNSAKDFSKTLDANVKSLQGALGQLRTLKQPTAQDTRNVDYGKALALEEKNAKATVRIRNAAEKEAADYSKQASLEAKVFYGQEAKDRVTLARNTARQIATAETEGAKLVSEANRKRDVAAIESAKLVRAARLEAARAQLVDDAKSLSSLSALSRARAENITNLQRYRAAAKTEADPEQQRALSTLIELEKARGTALNQTTRALESQQAAADRRLAAEGRLNSTLTNRTNKALAPAYVEDLVKNNGLTSAAEALAGERRVAQQALLIASTIEERQQALKNLDVANARVTAVQRLVAEEKRAVEAERRANGGGGAAAPEAKKTPLQNILSPGYAGAAFARTAIYGAAAGAAYGAFNTVESGVENLIQMEDELQKLQAISNSTSTQLLQLKGSIFAISESSRFSTIDLIKMAQVLAQAGVSASQMKDVLKSVATLATASGSTPDEAVQLVTSALGSFQLQASEAARVADLMTSALNRTKLTVQQTGQAIQYVGATAYEQNISLEQLLATVGAVAQAGIKSGSTIGTGFRQFLVDLQDPSKKLSEQLKLLGLTAADVDVAVRGLPAVLETLQKAGFGAGQAYAGLETRAAAFYLVAKNNVDIMDQLQLSFAQSGAAAIANDRAMNSLSAQWQRFKNIIGEGFSDKFETSLTVVQNILSNISDRIVQARQLQESGKASQGLQGVKKGGVLDTIANTDISPYIYNYGGKLLDAIGDEDTNARRHRLIDWLNSLSQSSTGASASSERLATQVAKTSEAAETQRGRISELDKEIQRLVVQKESLRGNDVRSAVETATLSARFVGLAANLTNTGNRYDDLTQAAKRYREEQLRSLNTSLDAQSSALSQQSADTRRGGTAAIQGILKNPGYVSQLNSQQLGALRNGFNSGDSRVFANSISIVADASKNLADSSPALSRALNDVVQAAGILAQNKPLQAAIGAQIANNTAANTPFGQRVNSTIVDVNAGITQLGSLANGSAAKGQLTSSLDKQLDTIESLIRERLKLGLGKGARDFLNSSLGDLPGLRQQIKALNTPSDEELKEAKKRPLITRQDLISAVTSDYNLPVGSGFRTKAAENALNAAGKTTATGDTSAHSNGGIGQDFPYSGSDGAQLAASIKKNLAQQGIDADVRFETGRGKNQGTGAHVHVGIRQGTRFTKDRSDIEANRQDSELANSGLATAKQQLTASLGDVAKATTQSTLDTAVLSAQVALATVQEDLDKAARADLLKQGIGDKSPQYAAKLAEVKAQKEQLFADFQTNLADALIKSVDAQQKATNTSFAAAIKPAQATQASADSRLSGLSYESLSGRVPDYVRQLAETSANRSRESLDRATLAALPAQISSTQATLSNAQDGLSTLTDPAAVQRMIDKIAELSNTLADLKSKRDALQEGLGAGGLIPTSLSQGLNQAASAYAEVNGLNNTFSQNLINNLGTAVDTVGKGLTDMFTSIATGSQNALQAFGSFALGIIRYLEQLAAELLAKQVLSTLFKLIGIGIAGSTGGPPSSFGTGSVGGDAGGIGPPGGFTGGRKTATGIEPHGYDTGGRVMNGSPLYDSVNARLAKDEWVIQKHAVDSVGHPFMADLNAKGAKALEGLGGSNTINNFLPKQQMSVYVVAPNTRPTMSKDDVLVILQDDILSGGETKKLIRAVSQGG